jgi:hypothetical protein
MKKREGHPIAILPEVRIVPLRVVRLIHLEEQAQTPSRNAQHIIDLRRP